MQKFLRTLMLMALMIVPFASHAQVIVEIGESTSTTTQYTVPVNMYYNYSLTQQIFTADEIGVAGTINSIAFEYTNTSSFSMDSVRVYMKNVTKTEFATTTDMEAITSTDLVWEGTLSAADAGWVTLTLTTPFVYDGTSNLLVCCYDNQSGYPGSAFKFRTTTTGSAYRGIAYYSDSYIPSIDDVTTFSGTKTRYTYRNNIQLGITPSGNYCEKPSNFEVSSITSDGATFTWATTSASSYQFEYKTSADTVWTEVTVTGNTYTLTTLSANTEYDVRVKAICGADSESGYKSASFRTACTAIATLPYTMGFEASEILATTPNADALPFCWSRYASGTGSYTYYPYSYSSSTYAHGGSSRVLYFYDGTGASYPDTMVAILPELDVVTYPMNANRLTFWGRVSSGTNVKNVQIGTMTDPTDMSTFAPVETVAVSGTTHTLYSVPLTNASATAPYLAIMLVKSASGYLCIDDLTLEEMPSCLEISNLAAGNITSSSVELTWSDAANASATYTVYNMADTSVVATGVTGTTYTVTGLNANTQYNFGVAANCPAGDASIMTVSTRTACAAEALPFSETFDASLSSNPCWAGANILYADGVTPTLGANNNWTYTSSASNGIEAGHYRVNIYGTSCYKWLITPAIDLTTATNPMLTFDAAFTVYSSTSTGPATGFENNDSQKFMVLVSTNNGQTWTVASDIPLTSIASGSYLTQYVNLAAYAGETVRVAFYAQSTVSGGDNNLHIDNISIDESTGEICYPTTGLTVSNITATSATVTWNSSTVGNYVLYIMNDSSSFMYTDTVADLNTLQPNTEYTVGVTVDCPSGESPMITTSFRTPCAAEALPFSETFDASLSSNPCWAGANILYADGVTPTMGANSNWTYTSTASNGIEAGHYRVNIYGTSCYKWLITPAIDLTTATNPMLTFDAAFTVYSSTSTGPATGFENNDSQKFMVLVSTNNGQTWTVASDIPLTSIASGSYLTQYVNLAAYAGETVRVAFYAQSTVSGGDNNLHIDNIAIDEVVGEICYPVTGLAASNITADGATLTWTGDAASYNVYVIAADTTLVQNVATTTLTLTGLTAMTQYTYGVTAVCTSSESDMVSVTFATACSSISLPFTETFETTSATTGCWTTDGPGTWTIATGDYSAATGAYEGSLNASITHGVTGDVTKFISPVLSGVTNGMQLQFAHIQRSWAGDIDNLAVYYRTSSDAVWQQLAAYTNEVAAWTVETINIPGTVYQVAFEYTDNYGYGVGVDSIAFNLPPACMPVVNLTASNITATGATLNWTGSAASYNVYSIDATGTATLVQNVTVDSIDLTGLTAMTAYTYGVRAVCGTDESEMTTVTFATACGGETCNIEINGADSYGDGWNGNAIQVMQAGNVIATFTLESGSSASAQIPVCSGYPVSFAWVLGNYPSETSFEIKDGAGMVVYSESGSNLTGGEVFYTMNDACPSCIPAAITVDTATTTSVTISWTGTAASYDVYNGETFVANVTTNTYTFTGLNPATTYTFGVQAICSATDTAALATITVMTACADITTLPYMEGFENGLGCWSTVNGSSDGMPWFTTNSSSSLIAHSGNAMAVSVSYYSGAMHANAWLISPKFILPTIGTGDTLNLSWWHKVSSNYPTELYDVMLSTTTDDTAAFTTTLLAVNPDSTSDWVNKVVDMSAYAGQSVYIAFHHHDSYDQNYLLIDDIALTIGAAPAPLPDTLTVTFAVNDATMGTTVPAPGTYQYISGDTLSFSAMPNTGYIFNGWVIAYGDGSVDSLSVDYISASAPADVFMNYSPMTITALFGTVDPNSDSMQVNVAVNDPTMGTTIPAPGTHYFHVGEVASVVAVPNDGYHLTGWTVNVVSEGVTYVDTTYNYAIDDVFDLFGGWVVSESNAVFTWTVTANFAAGEPPVMHDSVTVNVSVNNETMGVVTPAPGTHYYVLGDTVIMSIMPNPGYRVVSVQMSATHPILGTLFDESITDSLELAELVGVNDTLIVDDEEMYGMVVNINVIFAAEGTEPTTYSVEVAYDQTKGTVTGAGDYVEGSNVRLVAMPATHYEFYAWLDNNTGDTVSRESVYAIANIDRDYFLTAIFVASTGIDDVDMDNVTIYSTDNVIVVRGAEGKQVVLFDVNGRMLSREARAAENVEFRVNNSGVYLVKVANAAAKRVVVIR